MNPTASGTSGESHDTRTTDSTNHSVTHIPTPKLRKFIIRNSLWTSGESTGLTQKRWWSYSASRAMNNTSTRLEKTAPAPKS